MIAQWILGKKCDVSEFADKIRLCPMDVVCVSLTKSVTSVDSIFKFLEYLAAGIAASGAIDFLDRSGGSSMNLREVAKVQEVLEEKAVLCLASSVWIVVNRCKVTKMTFIEGSYRSGGSVPAISFGHVSLYLNTARQRMEQINIGVLFVHRAASKTDKERMTQWLVVKKIAILCGFYPKGENACNFASNLARDAGAIGWGPCAQEVDVKNNRSGGMVTKTHPSFIMCFGFFNRFWWPPSTAVPDDFVMGADVLKELVPTQEVPQWEENYEGSTSVPQLGTIKQKAPNFQMWCRNSFQNCVWMGTSIPSKKTRKDLRQQQKTADRQ